MSATPFKPFMGRSEFAAHIGCAKSYITKLGTQGRLVMGQGDNAERIDVAATKALLVQTTGAPERAVESATTFAFTDAKEHGEKYKALMAQMDYEERCGQLVTAADMRAVLVTAATSLRTRLEALPDTLAPQLAAAAEESQVKAILAGEIEAALSELSHQFGKLLEVDHGRA